MSIEELSETKTSLLDVIKEEAERDVNTITKFVNSADSSFQFYKYMIKSIQQVFIDGIEKIKFALVLPYLIDEQCELEKYLSSDMLNSINTLCEKNYFMKLIEKHDVDNTIPNIQAVNLDFHIIEAIEILQNSVDLKANLNKYLEKISTIGTRILNVITIIEQIATTRFWVAVLSVEANETTILPKTNDLEKSRKITSQLLALQDMEENIKRQIQIKTELVQTYQLDLISQQKQLNYKKNKSAMNANSQIEEICSRNDSNRAKVDEEIEELKKNYEKYQHTNLQNDKKLRERKKRFLIQLQAWIKKYEVDVTDKVKENFEIDEMIAVEKKKIEEFMIPFKIQEAEYLFVWKRKLAEKELALRKSIKKYQKNRAARTLQRYWRLFLEKKKKKRK